MLDTSTADHRPTSSSLAASAVPIILGCGSYVPENKVTNDDLSQKMDTSHDWIVKRTGIESRHFVDFDKEPMGASDLALRACKKALADAQLDTQEIDLIVYATLSPDKFFPGDGVLLQAKLGIEKPIPAIDVRNQCSGFLYALAIADAMLRTGRYHNALVVGAELHSTGLDFSSRGRDVAVLFGDGAAAMVLTSRPYFQQLTKSPLTTGNRGFFPELLSVHLHADGRYADALQCAYPASCQMPRISEADIAAAKHYPSMNGRFVYKHAVQRLPEAILEALAAHDLSIKDLSLLIPHQANLRINEAVGQKLGLASEQIYNNIMFYGNTTACSIPLAFDEAKKQQRLSAGDIICLAAFGSGFTWASALLRMAVG